MKAATLLAVTLASCATVPPIAAGPTAAVGQTVYINGLQVRPLEIIEDSRCPTDVVCVWAGRIVVKTEVIGGSSRETLDLELGKAQQVADGALTLVAVHPPKQAGTATDARAYRFTFDFQGGL